MTSRKSTNNQSYGWPRSAFESRAYRRALGLTLFFFLLYPGSESLAKTGVNNQSLCESIISRHAWRVFAGRAYLVSREKKENFEKACLRDKKPATSEDWVIFNAAVVAWLEDRKNVSEDLLKKASGAAKEAATLSLALFPDDKQRKIKNLKKLISEGHDGAQIELALLMERNNENFEFIFHTLRPWAVRGDYEAAFYLGMLFIDPIIKRRNSMRAKFYFGFATLINSPEHLYIVARMFSEIEHIEDREKSIYAMLRAAYFGHTQAIEIFSSAVAEEDVAPELMPRVMAVLCKTGNKQLSANFIDRKYGKTLECRSAEASVGDK